jgi:predicted O-linked N-acetylglucosamine transferase (SPINDLY family)
MGLLLDTFPYNAHTMASDALWMGCPLVTLQGKSFASRVGASLLQAVLPEHRNKLVAGSLDEYHRLIHEWVGHPEELRQLRTVLDAARSTSPLFKAQRFVRCFEEGLLKAWRLNMSGKPPEDIVVI